MDTSDCCAVLNPNFYASQETRPPETLLHSFYSTYVALPKRESSFSLSVLFGFWAQWNTDNHMSHDNQRGPYTMATPSLNTASWSPFVQSELCSILIRSHPSRVNVEMRGSRMRSILGKKSEWSLTESYGQPQTVIDLVIQILQE